MISLALKFFALTAWNITLQFTPVSILEETFSISNTIASSAQIQTTNLLHFLGTLFGNYFKRFASSKLGVWTPSDLSSRLLNRAVNCSTSPTSFSIQSLSFAPLQIPQASVKKIGLPVSNCPVFFLVSPVQPVKNSVCLILEHFSISKKNISALALRAVRDV